MKKRIGGKGHLFLSAENARAILPWSFPTLPNRSKNGVELVIDRRQRGEAMSDSFTKTVALFEWFAYLRPISIKRQLLGSHFEQRLIQLRIIMVNSDLHALDSANTRPPKKAAQAGYAFNAALPERYGHVGLSSTRIMVGVMMIAALAISRAEIGQRQKDINGLTTTQAAAQFIPTAFIA